MNPQYTYSHRQIRWQGHTGGHGVATNEDEDRRPLGTTEEDRYTSQRFLLLDTVLCACVCVCVCMCVCVCVCVMRKKGRARVHPSSRLRSWSGVRAPGEWSVQNQDKSRQIKTRQIDKKDEVPWSEEHPLSHPRKSHWAAG